MKDCGHSCKGVEGESECLPCMDPDCDSNNLAIQPQDMIDMDDDVPKLERKRSLINGYSTDMCGICHVVELGAKPCVALTCRHVYHAACIANKIKKRATRRITFTHLDCPVCKVEIGLNES